MLHRLFIKPLPQQKAGRKRQNSAPKETEKTIEEKRALLKSVASNDEARKAYAESRASVLLPLIPTQSTIRSIFTPEDLAPDAQPLYPISFDYTEFAAYLPKFGGTVVQVTEGSEVFIPTFGIEGAYRYSMDIAEQGRIDIAENSNKQLLSRIVAKEEFAGWRLIKGVMSGVYGKQTVYCSGNSVDGVGTPSNFSYFSKASINRMKVQMDIQRRDLTDMYLSPRSLGDIREWTQTSIDFLTQRDIFQNGGLPGGGPDGGLWGVDFHKVYNSSLVDDTQVWGFDKKTFGKMPIRKQFTTYEDPTAILQWQIGVQGREIVGFGVTDTWAMVQAVLTSPHVSATSC